ncbi:protein-L-isoaspartate(D-aspartate) O-methyltransferase [Allosphingosinicella sp.]|jgi:protein-L-isoaspartate(D-aspartate) O-methyltransferase|uniref:protein-L-isoaspartate(D-aspartate) O-methyltransferase n=1 Tax=Allosphingosinicella sp. TaxID=2823234 RepID=UPI002F19198B
MLRNLILAALLSTGIAAADGDRESERERMVLGVANLVATSGARAGRDLRPEVLEAMRRVPRHLFVPEDVRAEAYRQHPLPIGHDATISAPTIVALMTELLDPRPGDRVLEVGTGSGYQAAVLSGLVGEVFSIEIVEPLARSARERLAGLGYANVTVRAGDGYAGWPEHSPFDKIIVTAAAPRVPQPLIDQLRPGGRMVIPVGTASDAHDLLLLIEKGADGRIRRRSILPVRFVPLVRGR